MNRRSFFGAATAAAVAGPSVAKEVVAAKAPNIVTLAMSLDTAPALEALAGYSAAIGRARAFQFGGGRDRYVYRTGYPSIDALRSVSGVHKERMEKRLVG